MTLVSHDFRVWHPVPSSPSNQKGLDQDPDSLLEYNRRARVFPRALRPPEGRLAGPGPGMGIDWGHGVRWGRDGTGRHRREPQTQTARTHCLSRRPRLVRLRSRPYVGLCQEKPPRLSCIDACLDEAPGSPCSLRLDFR